MVSGGPDYHSMNSYFPIPYSHHLIQGSPNADYPQLLPKFSLSDGSQLMPLVYMTRYPGKGKQRDVPPGRIRPCRRQGAREG